MPPSCEINRSKAESVAVSLMEWGHQDATPVQLTIGRSAYTGARYVHIPDGDARYYLLGALPPSSRRGTVYRLPGDDGDWYIACWIDAEAAENPARRGFHPHGAWFALHRWPHERFGKRIDADEERERRRMTISKEQA